MSIDALQATRLKPEATLEQRAHAVAKDFEAVFIGQMFNLMFKGIPTDGFMKGGTGERIFQGMLVDEYAKQVSKTKGLGIAEAIEKQILKYSRLAKGEGIYDYTAQVDKLRHDPLTAITETGHIDWKGV